MANTISKTRAMTTATTNEPRNYESIELHKPKKNK